MKLAQELLFSIITTYPVSKKQIYAGGLSMGGMGTFEIVRRNPELFAAAFPICGGGNPATASQLKKVKWWVFHGAKDDVVPPKLSEEMVKALKKKKATVKFTLYPPKTQCKIVDKRINILVFLRSNIAKSSMIIKSRIMFNSI